jgi:ABC-type transport system involved in multi-copper enzyme maturation permease subunit
MGSGRLSRIVAVASNTFRETVRERVLYGLVVFAILMMASGLVMRDLSIRQDTKVIKDLALAVMDVLGTFIALFLGVGLVSKEIEKRSLYPLLAKPLGRDEFLLGKFLGLAFTLLVNVGLMTVGLYLTLLATHTAKISRLTQLDPVLLQAVLGIYVSLLLVVGVGILFSVVTSTTMAAVLTLAVVVAGRFADVIRNMGEVLPAAPGWLVQAVYLALPNFRDFDLKARAVHGDPVGATTLALIVLYGLAYCAAVLAAAGVLFRRKELT